MKFLIDQHLSPKLVGVFNSDFPGSLHVSQIGLDESPDVEIWKYAKDMGFLILTKDSDYHDMGMRMGFPPQVVLIKRGNCSTKSISELVTKSAQRIKDFSKELDQGILILF